MSAESMGYVRTVSPFQGATFLVHLVVADLVSEAHDYELWCTQGWLAERSRVSVRGVQRALDQMIEEGWLTVLEPNKAVGKPNRYRFEFPVDNPGVRPKLAEIGYDKVSYGYDTLSEGVRQGVVQNPKNSNEQTRDFSEEKSTGFFLAGTGWVNEYKSDKDEGS